MTIEEAEKEVEECKEALREEQKDYSKNRYNARADIWKRIINILDNTIDMKKHRLAKGLPDPENLEANLDSINEQIINNLKEQLLWM